MIDINLSLKRKILQQNTINAKESIKEEIWWLSIGMGVNYRDSQWVLIYIKNVIWDNNFSSSM